MIRTQVYLDEDQAQEISFIAKRQKKEKAKVIRALIQKGIDAEKNKESLGDSLMALVDLGKKLNLKGPTDLSTNLDKYLYKE